MRRRASIVAALAVGLVGTVVTAIPDAVALADDIEPPTSTVVVDAGGASHVQHDGVFTGTTSTGAFRVPYRITTPLHLAEANGAVVVEAPHFATGLGTLEFQMGERFLLGRGFVHAGVGYSTTSIGPGLRILDPSVPGTYIEGGFADVDGRTDDEILSDFARALASDPHGQAMVGPVRNAYVTGFSDAASAVLRLLASGHADSVFDLAFPYTAEDPVDPRAALEDGAFDGKVMIVNSAAEDSSNFVDLGAHPDQYRFYAVADTPHVSDPLVPLFSNQTTPATWLPALRAHFLQAHRWVRNRVAPPPSATLSDDVPGLPFVELGEAVFHTGFLGTYEDVKSVADLGYANHQAYSRAFNTAVEDYLRAGSILPTEAAEMRRRARLCAPLTYTETYRDHYDNFVTLTPCGP